jgi:peptidyl-dipeptidase Dcp
MPNNPLLQKWTTPFGTAPFQAKGLFNPALAKSFRDNILAKGSTEEPMALYKRFRGSEPGVEPLLKRRGLLVQ